MNKIVPPKISVVGLGKLGLCLAACFASKGYRVLGIDINSNIVAAINAGQSPIAEKGLGELLKRVKKRLQVTSDHRRAIGETDITIVIVATPSDRKDNFSNKYIETALKSLSAALKNSPKKYHLFIVSSTVMPTTINEKLIPLIEKYSNRRLNKGFGVCYIPDFVALGSVIHDFLNPDLVLIGESDKHAGSLSQKLYQSLCPVGTPVFRMSLINAEIVKMALNTFITMKISFANSIANICERIPGGSVDKVCKALGADRRISPYYLKGGLGYGGTCFPRDTGAFRALGKKFKIKTPLVEATEEINNLQNKLLLEKVLRAAADSGENSVTVLGMAFKPGTSVITESPGIKLVRSLIEKRFRVYVYDPLAMENTKSKFNSRVIYCASVAEAIAKSKLCVIATSDKIYKTIDSKLLRDNHTIIDCWRILNRQKLPESTKYIPLGIHQ